MLLARVTVAAGEPSGTRITGVDDDDDTTAFFNALAESLYDKPSPRIDSKSYSLLFSGLVAAICRLCGVDIRRTRESDDCIENDSTTGEAPATSTAAMAYVENFMVMMGVLLLYLFLSRRPCVGYYFST